MIVFSRADQRIYYQGKSWECHSAIWEGVNAAGVRRETLPLGFYTVSAEEPGIKQGYAYGTFYIETGDPRERDIHGGGSDLEDPYAPEQGFEATYGCLRMLNRDGEELSQMIIDNGNAIPLKVQEESYAQ